MSATAISLSLVEEPETSSRDFDSLVKDYAPRLLSVARKRLNDPHLAEDAVQETFLRAFKSLNQFDRSRPILPWLTTICKNICTDYVRQRYSNTEIPTEEIPVIATDDSRNDPAEQFMERERATGMGVALKALCRRQKRVLMLREVEGWRFEDIAVLEDTSIEALKEVLKRARKTFRKSYMAVAAERGLSSVIFAPFGVILGVLRSKLHKSSLAVKISSGAAGLTTAAQVLIVTSIVGATAVAAVTIGGIANGLFSDASSGATPKVVEQGSANADALEDKAESAIDASVSTESLAGGASAAQVSVDIGRDKKDETLNGKLGSKLGTDVHGSSTVVWVKCSGEIREKACDAVDLLPNAPHP